MVCLVQFVLRVVFDVIAHPLRHLMKAVSFQCLEDLFLSRVEAIVVCHLQYAFDASVWNAQFKLSVVLYPIQQVNSDEKGILIALFWTSGLLCLPCLHIIASRKHSIAKVCN